MTNGSGRNGKDVAMFLAVALVGGGGGSVLQNTIFDPRPDPFTGSQGSALEIRIKALEQSSSRKWEKLDSIHNTLHRIELSIASLPPKEWRDRIRALEYRAKSGAAKAPPGH